MAKKNEPAPAADTGPVAALSVRSRPESFCRCGRRFTREATLIPLAELTEEEVARLAAEPQLAVEHTEIAPVAAGETA